MGTLRLLLAVAVVLTHISGLRYSATGGQTSVQCFYMISGFFISMILDQKYNKKGDLKLFYSNRFLRIFSVYWVFLALSMSLTFLAYVGTHHGTVATWVENWRRLGVSGVIFLAFSNVFVVGQDWTLFQRIGSSGLEWTTNFRNSDPIVPGFLFVPPAWSLGVELSFYALAPLLTRLRTSMVAGVIVLACALRFGFHLRGLDVDPWSYRFFPFEIALFLVGTLSYRLYRKIKERGGELPLSWKLFAFGVFPLILAFPYYDHSDGMFFAPGRLFLYLYLALAIPILFRLSGRIKVERSIGELSYPLYLCHAIVITTVEHFKSRVPQLWGRTALILTVSIGIAYLTATYLDEPIDRFRQFRVARNHALKK